MTRKKSATAKTATPQVHKRNRSIDRQRRGEIHSLRRLLRRYRRVALAAILLGEVKAGVALAITDLGGILWWANLGWASTLLAGAGYLLVPHLKRLAELADPTRSATAAHAKG